MSVEDQRAQSVKLKILEAAMYWREALPDETIRLYARELADMEPAEVYEGLEALKRDPKIKRFPLPSEIRAAARPEITVADESRLISARILEAIGKVGPYELARAKEFIGPAGWEVVTRLGGWLQVCEEVDYSNMNSMQAQIRDLAASVLNSARAGKLSVPIELPAPSRKPAPGSPALSSPKSVGDILKSALQNRPHEPGEEKLARSHEGDGSGHQGR